MDQAELERPYSREWWEGRTLSELNDIIRGGFAAGDFGIQAHQELERRARALEKVEKHEAELQVAHGATMRLRILGGVLVFLLVLIALVEWLR